jgi:hypothetical protein
MLTELASYLQRDVDTASATLARALAEGLVEEEVGRLEPTTSTITLPLDVHTGCIALSVAGPITDVSAVEVAGTAAAFEWEKPFPRVRLTTWTPSSTATWHVADVTLVHGWATIPAVVKAVGLSVAARAYTNPGGFRQETIDDNSVTRAGGDDDLAGLTLTGAERAVLQRFRSDVFVTEG